MKYIFLSVIIAFCVSCVNLEVITTSIDSVVDPDDNYSINTDEVIIYSSMRPDNMSDYQEIGIIVLRGDNPQVDEIFKLLRAEAARRGAEYIIDFTIKGNLETRTSTHTVTSANGFSSTVTSSETVIAFTATGTLLRRIKK